MKKVQLYQTVYYHLYGQVLWAVQLLEYGPGHSREAGGLLTAALVDCEGRIKREVVGGDRACEIISFGELAEK